MYNHTVKFLPQHCTLEYFTEEHIQALTWTVALFLHYSECGFWRVPPQSWSVKFLFVVYEKTSCFPWLVECDELQRRHLSFRKSTTGKIIQPLAYWLKCTHWSHTMKLKHVLLTSSMCSSCWDYILVLLFYFKLLSCKKVSGESDIKSTHRMEKLSAWFDKVAVLSFSTERRQMKFARAFVMCPFKVISVDL